MNIFHKVALQGLKKNRTRTIVTIIGVILSAAMITAVTTFGVSLLNYMTNGAIQKYGNWHVNFLNVNSSFVEQQAEDVHVLNTVTFENIGYATLKGGKNEKKPYLFIAGFTKDAFTSMPLHLISGRLPKNNGEILVPSHVANNGGVKFSVGDTLNLEVGNRQAGGETLTQHDSYQAGEEILVQSKEKSYTVVGIYQRPTFEERSAPGYTLITTADGNINNFSLFVTLKKASQIHTYINDITKDYSYVLNDEVLRFMGLSNDKLFNTLLYAVGGIVVVIIMIGSIFLIYNSFSISLNERTHQIGILASVGATARQLRNSVLFEGFCIGMIGIPIGVIIGIGGMGIVISIVAKSFGDILYSGVPLTLTVSLPAIIGATIISLITILISAYIPAKKAAAIPVMECIRQTNEIKVESKTVKISWLEQHLYGLEGILALKNFKRNKKRYRSIVLSLVLSIVLFISTNAFVIYLKQASEQAVVFTTYDIGLGSLEMEDDSMLALYDQLKNTEGVTASSYQTLIKYRCTVPKDNLSDAYWQNAKNQTSNKTVDLTLDVQFLDDDTYLGIIQSLNLPVEEYTGPNAKLVAIAKMYINDNRLHEASEFPDLFTSSSLALNITPKSSKGKAKEQTVNITFANFIPPDIPPVSMDFSEELPYSIQVVAPWSLKETLAPADSGIQIYSKGITFQSTTPKQSTAKMKEIIGNEGITTEYTLMNVHEALQESQNYIFIANVFAYTFIIMISLIAVANIFNTISTNIKLRRQELAMLRSIGMSDQDFNKMMRFECAFYGIQALIIGIPLALICSLLIYKGMYTGGAEGVEFVMPWASIGISICSVLLIIFVTMMYAVSKIKKENIIDALRDDMT